MYDVDEDDGLDTVFTLNVTESAQFPTLVVVGTITAEAVDNTSKWYSLNLVWCPHLMFSASLFLCR